MVLHPRALWKAYSLATGFVANIAALTVSAALSESVSATAAGILVAAAILELVPWGSDLLLKRSVARMRSAATPEEHGEAALTGLMIVVFDGVWIVAGVAVADWREPNFDISGLRAYVGTVALVYAANFAIYLPLYLVRKWRQMS